MTRDALKHPVVRRLVCACRTVDEPLLWEWLVEELDPGRFTVVETELSGDASRRRTVLAFASELDGHRFVGWARGRRFDVDDCVRTGREAQTNDEPPGAPP